MVKQVIFIKLTIYHRCFIGIIGHCHITAGRGIFKVISTRLAVKADPVPS